MENDTTIWSWSKFFFIWIWNLKMCFRCFIITIMSQYIWFDSASYFVYSQLFSYNQHNRSIILITKFSFHSLQNIQTALWYTFVCSGYINSWSTFQKIIHPFPNRMKSYLNDYINGNIPYNVDKFDHNHLHSILKQLSITMNFLKMTICST